MELPTTKVGWKRAVKRMLHYPAGTILEGDDDRIARALIAMHPAAEEKIGAGVRYVVIRENAYGNANELYIIRVDDSRTDVSYQRCLEPRTPAADRALVVAALRWEVRDQVLNFRTSQWGNGREVRCAMTGALLTPETVHVDHAPPYTFATIAGEWLKGRQLPRLISQGTTGAMPGRKLADRAEAEDFRRFHAAHAQLRLLHIDAHAELTREQARQRWT